MRAMKFQGLLFILFLATASGTPIRDRDIQVQENFDPDRIYGKWYDIAIGTTCQWMKNYKDKFNMGTLVLEPGLTSDQISTTKLGHFTAHVSIVSYVLHTNYDEYSIMLMEKKSTFGLTTTLKLYGRSPVVRESLIEEFRLLAHELGIPDDSIFILINKGNQAIIRGLLSGASPPFCLDTSAICLSMWLSLLVSPGLISVSVGLVDYLQHDCSSSVSV
uniref:Lipocalin/cytosolic fatty-acid binding domain-containing protein n=1 Tax=Crocodylus porosus TaxID=8502 RepID=A0A7M4EWE9_CROPO